MATKKFDNNILIVMKLSWSFLFTYSFPETQFIVIVDLFQKLII